MSFKICYPICFIFYKLFILWTVNISKVCLFVKGIQINRSFINNSLSSKVRDKMYKINNFNSFVFPRTPTRVNFPLSLTSYANSLYTQKVDKSFLLKWGFVQFVFNSSSVYFIFSSFTNKTVYFSRIDLVFSKQVNLISRVPKFSISCPLYFVDRK